MPHRNRILFKLYPGSENEPTRRRRGLFVIEELQKRGWEVFTRETDAPLVVLQRLANPSEVRHHQAAGRIVIFETNDNLLFKDTVFYVPTERETVSIADYVVVTCRYMQERYARINPRTLIAPEALEPEFWTTPRPNLPKKPLILSWHGMPDNLQYVEPIVERLADVKHLRLKIVMPDRDSKKRSNAKRVEGWPVQTEFATWRRESFVSEIAGAHAGLVVLPDTEFCRCKAHHKVVGYHALRMPTIASSVPGYREVIKHGETGLLAETVEDWIEGIERLRDPEERDRMAGAAHELSLNFTQEAIGKLWDRMLRSILEHGRKAA